MNRFSRNWKRRHHSWNSEVRTIVQRTGLTSRQVRLLKALAWGGVRTYREFSEVLYDHTNGAVRTAMYTNIRRLRESLPWLVVVPVATEGYMVPDDNIIALRSFLDGDL